jgi:beta-1,4-mannosyltransferase
VTGPGTVRPVRVLQSVRRPTPETNPYVVQLVGSIRDAGAEVEWFTWWQGLRGRYDVLHVHWPEIMIRRSGRAARVAARVRFAALLLRLTATRTPLVRTLHNVGAHERGGWWEHALLRWCDRRTAYWIRLNPHTPLPRPAPVAVIPHGHYTDWYGGIPAGEPVPGRVLTFGLLRPFKGTDALVAAVAGLPGEQLTLRVVGRPVVPEMRVLVEAAVAADPRVTAVLDYVEDTALAAEIAAAQLVVLPYRALHNSGALLLALSLGRPVLAPAAPSAVELAVEVGPGWLHLYEGELTAEVLGKALAATRDLPGAPPDLRRREWPLIGRRHVEVYRDALVRAGGV